MGFSKTTGFFSYAHNDDTFDFLKNLRSDLCDEYRVVTGDELELFFDRKSIGWGTQWKKSISDSIDSAGIFIPVISPCYFASSACMGELAQYFYKVEKSGASDLILPLLYSETPFGGANDQMLEKLMSFQYKDIRDMRFVERGSGEYVRFLNDLALSIYKAQESLEAVAIRSVVAPAEAPVCPGAEDFEADDVTDKAFFLDAAAELPEKTSRMTESVESLVKNIDDIGGVFNEGNGKVGESCNPKDAVAVLAGISRKLDPLANDMLRNAEDFSALVAETDPLIRAIAEAKDLNTIQVNDFSLGFDDLVANAESAKNGIASFHDVTRDAERFSRVLYKPLKKIERAAAICGNAIDVVISWGNLELNAPGNERKGEEDA